MFCSSEKSSNCEHNHEPCIVLLDYKMLCEVNVVSFRYLHVPWYGHDQEPVATMMNHQGGKHTLGTTKCHPLLSTHLGQFMHGAAHVTGRP
jgi:hypothetical protein